MVSMAVALVPRLQSEASSDSQIDKPPHGRPKRAELPDANINTGAQNINTERASLSDSVCLSFCLSVSQTSLFFTLLPVDRMSC